MNIQHLDEFRQLPAMVRALPVADFDMASWQCGTVACAIGHGINLGIISGMTMRPTGMGPSPCFKTEIGLSAVESYFGISRLACHHLFTASEYPRSYKKRGLSFTDREFVARRIEKFLAEHAPADIILEIKPEAARELARS